MLLGVLHRNIHQGYDKVLNKKETETSQTCGRQSHLVSSRMVESR